MEVNVEFNKRNYKLEDFDQCDCIYCNFYRENINQAHPMVNEYLTNLGIDIEKPFELSLPFINDQGLIEYPFAQYVSMGMCNNDFNEVIDNISLTKASYHPNVNLTGDYFVMEISSLVFDLTLASEVLLENME